MHPITVGCAVPGALPRRSLCMRVQDVFFSGIGIYLPEIESVESAVARGLYPADEVAAVGYSGATVAEGIPAPEMALRAARDALKNGGVSPDDLAALLY